MARSAEKKSVFSIGENGLERAKENRRLEVLKTYKVYIGGQFPRTESGRYYTLSNAAGTPVANVCACSRKDVRDAVLAARNAFRGWSARTAFNRGQILYRMAEMLEGRKAQFIEELKKQDLSTTLAQKEVVCSIDRLIYYAGWCDKFQQVFSSVNPVASPHFNFSVCEPVGTVAIIPQPESPLLGLVSLVAPVIAGGNTALVLASETAPLAAVSFAEVIHSSDVPGGVVNILTGKRKELVPAIGSHMDINAVTYANHDAAEMKMLQEQAAVNVKRIHFYQRDWMQPGAQSPYVILDTQEIKTTWHPIETSGGGGAGY